MKHSLLKITLVGFLFSTAVTVTSCKGKSKEATESTSTTPTTEVAPPPAPVEIAEDTTLTSGIKDATKDYPGVNATVNNGEITLTGEIERSRLPNLMQSLNSLRPKKITNNLKLK